MEAGRTTGVCRSRRENVAMDKKLRQQRNDDTETVDQLTDWCWCDYGYCGEATVVKVQNGDASELGENEGANIYGG